MAPKLAALQTSGVFAFSREQLSTLHNTKNSTAFLQVGGLEGLVKGLRSDRTKGIGRPVEEAAADSTSLRMLSSSSVWHDRGVLRYVALPTRKNVTAGESPPNTTAGLFAERRAVFGNNQLPTKKQPSFIHMVWRAYNDPVLFFLTGAAAISLAIGLYQTFTSTHSVNNPPLEWVDGVTILVAVIIIVLVGSINDWVKSQRFQKLNEKQLEQDSSVIRFGVSRRIPNSEIYVGDVVHLEAGDVIPADGILVSGHKVMCDESSVTGALELVLKTPGDEAFRAMSEQNETSLDPFILSGTKVLEGVGTFLVTSTGVHSIYGKILESLRDQPDPVPLLQARLTVVAKQLAWMGGIISLVLFVALFIKFLAGLHRDSSSPAGKAKNFVDIAIIALSVLVIAAPEGLPLALALSLAQAATRMLKENVLVRQLKACETMGNATNLCTDKTGMLTQNKMAVVAGTVGLNFRFYDKRGVSVSSLGPESSTEDSAHGLAEDVRKLLRESIVLNTAPFEVDHEFSIVGSNTESTLLKFAEDHLGMCLLEEERQKENMVQFIPLDSAHKCIATVIELPSPVCKYRVFIKGAPEILLSKSTRIIPDPSTASSDIELNSTGREQVARTIDSYANQALRTIGLAYRDLPLPSQKDGTRKSKTDFTIDYLLNDLVFLAVMAIHDPLRPGVSQTVQTCQRANVIVRMVTGDNILTATAIAKQCGIYSDNSEDIAMEGTQFWALPDDELALKLPHLKVLARASPEDKQKLVVRLKGVGEVVAYAGDGTNDALAMSAADVSFAMGGVTGTEVARQASSIILLTDDFTCIIKAIMWGRAVKDSVKKYLLVSLYNLLTIKMACSYC
jgi:Ca2+-transporting ATPase